MANKEDISTGTETGEYAEIQDKYVYTIDQDVHVQNNNTNYHAEIKNHVTPPSTCPQVVIQSQPLFVTRPRDYMCLSIFSCLCCIWPIGLVAICFSSAARRASSVSSAKRKGKVALVLSILSIIGGVIIISNIIVKVKGT